jgi:hypothetical protein
MCKKDNVFIWNMLSLNGIRLFGGKPNTKNRASLAQNGQYLIIIGGRYICYHSHSLWGDYNIPHCLGVTKIMHLYDMRPSKWYETTMFFFLKRIILKVKL